MPERVKGQTELVFSNQTVNAISGVFDCRDFNALHIQVNAAGGQIGCSLFVYGSTSPASFYALLPDPWANTNQLTGSLQGTANSRAFDVLCGAPYYVVELRGISTSNVFYTVKVTPFLSAGILPYVSSRRAIRNLSGAAQSIQSNPGMLHGLQILNGQAAAAFVGLYDGTAGSVTVGTTEPALEFRVPGDSQMNVPLPAGGVRFTTAIAVASTTGAGGSGTGSAAGVHVFAQYT